MPDVTPERERAADIQQRYSATLKQLRGDRDLSDDGRRRRIAQEWKTTRAQLDKLRAAERDRLSTREQELERRLFGSFAGATDAISTRDAQDRASRVTRPDEAARLLHRAEQNDDQALARAVAHHSLQQSRAAMTSDAALAWDEVVGAFLDVRPHMTEVVEELAKIERLNAPQVFGPFSLPPPDGVRPVDINSASGAPVGAA